MTRRRVLTGIYRDRYGFETRVHWRGQQRSKRFPLGTDAAVMQRWREATLAELADADPVGPPHSFRELARDYLHSAAFLRLSSQSDRRRDVETWIDVFGDTPAALVQARECQRVIDGWQAEGYAASTLNHGIDALVAVLPRLRGQVQRERAPDPVPRTVPRARIVAVLQSLKPSTTATRLWWLFWTGMRPAQLRRLELRDVDWTAATVTVPAGKSGRAYVVPLSPDAVEQLRPLTTADTFGSLSNGSANRVLMRACAACKVPRFSLYALRRSFGSTLRAAGVDLADVQHLMGHRRIDTTARYAPVVESKHQAAVTALGVAGPRGSRKGPPPLGD